MDRLQFPNPQKIRKNWLDLNGTWQFAIPTADIGDASPDRNNLLAGTVEAQRAAESTVFPEFDRTITVPYSYTFPKSGVNVAQYHPVVWYRRQFDLSPDESKRYLLTFEAVDYASDVWLNGTHIAHHEGGHTPFTVDITENLHPVNELVVKVVDFNLPDQPIGKQSWKDGNFACWYTRTIGIWQSVWIEETGDAYLSDFTLTPDLAESRVVVDAEINTLRAAQLRYVVSFHGQEIARGTTSLSNGRGHFDIKVDNFDPAPDIHPWTPENPDLYDIDFTVIRDDDVTDEVSSYFGMRSLTSDGDLLFLNGQKYYLKLLLNQGYYPGAGLTGTADVVRSDIEKMKRMGFNGNRIHQKIESNRALYLCDSLGFLVWAEFPSAYEFGTTLMENIERELPTFVRKHVNHPSVVAYVAMNESWGVFTITHDRRQQLFVDALYHQLKSADPTRLVIGNDGYEQVTTDICTIHDYNSDPEELLATYQGHEDSVRAGAPSPMSGRRVFVEGYENQRNPVMITEYGGVAYEASSRSGDSWGYGERATDPDEVVSRIAALTKAVMSIDYCVGFCYTQTSDVEQEVNGLLDHDHEYKFDPEKIREILLSGHTYGYVQI